MLIQIYRQNLYIKTTVYFEMKTEAAYLGVTNLLIECFNLDLKNFVKYTFFYSQIVAREGEPLHIFL